MTYYQLDCEHGADPKVPHYARCFKPITEPLLSRAEWEATIEGATMTVEEGGHIIGGETVLAPGRYVVIPVDAAVKGDT